MTTVINNPGEGSGAGAIIGVVVALAIIALLFVYGLPAIRNKTADNAAPSASVNVTLPSSNDKGTNGQ